MHRTFPFRKPRDFYPEIVERLQQEFAAKATADTVAAAKRVAASKPQPQIQPSIVPPAQIPTATQNLPLRDAAQQPSSKPAPGTRKPAARAKASPRVRPRPKPAPADDSIAARHARKCKICNHPDREAFEADFLDWCQASWLERTYHIRDEATIYRHARATGLLQRRRENVGMVAEKLLEHVDAIDTPSAFAILRAIRTLACLNERGQWAEPPTTHIVVNSSESSNLQNPNRQSYEKLELDVTDTKHTPEVVSNRQ